MCTDYRVACACRVYCLSCLDVCSLMFVAGAEDTPERMEWGVPESGSGAESASERVESLGLT